MWTMRYQIFEAVDHYWLQRSSKFYIYFLCKFLHYFKIACSVRFWSNLFRHDWKMFSNLTAVFQSKIILCVSSVQSLLYLWVAYLWSDLIQIPFHVWMPPNVNPIYAEKLGYAFGISYQQHFITILCRNQSAFSVSVHLHMVMHNIAPTDLSE